MLIMLADKPSMFKVSCLENGEEFALVQFLLIGIEYTWLNNWESCPETVEMVQTFVEKEVKRLWPKQNLTSINGLDVY